MKKGLSNSVVKTISHYKNEPKWMRDFRLKSYQTFLALPLPRWGPNLSELNFDDIYYYIKPVSTPSHSWKTVPPKIKATFNKLGLPQAEQKYLAGLGSQYDSEMVYHNLQRELQKSGVIFSDIETALKTYPDLVKKYFATVVPAGDNKFAALNSACFSGGSFIYVPKGVKLEQPLHAYFRIQAKQMGQFERTLIIVDEGSSLHYIEGCSAPQYTTSSLHAAVVEIIVKKKARLLYSTLQNWSKNVYNLVTKRAIVDENAVIEWTDFNFGSRCTMKYPSVFLKGKGAKANMLSMSFAGQGQVQDNGAKALHLADSTSSSIVSKSLAKNGGCAIFRGSVKVNPHLKEIKSKIRCDSLILDSNSRAESYPAIQSESNEVQIAHEATISKINEEQLFYLRSRGLTEDEATLLIVNGFMEPIVQTVPVEYAVEMTRMMAFF